jgi:hypothetical protein
LGKKRCEEMRGRKIKVMGGSSREMCMRDTANIPELYEIMEEGI